MVQNLLVALIVALAAAHACARYLPASWRQRIVYLLTRRGTRFPLLAKWFRTEASCGSGCDTCKSCDTPASTPASTPPAARAGDEHIITLHRRK